MNRIQKQSLAFAACAVLAFYGCGPSPVDYLLDHTETVKGAGINGDETARRAGRMIFIPPLIEMDVDTQIVVDLANPRSLNFWMRLTDQVSGGAVQVGEGSPYAPPPPVADFTLEREGHHRAIITVSGRTEHRKYRFILAMGSADGLRDFASWELDPVECISFDTGLKKLTLTDGEGERSFVWDGVRGAYTAEVNHDVSSIEITAESINPAASVSGGGTKTLDLDEKHFTITVAIPAPPITKVYPLVVSKRTGDLPAFTAAPVLSASAGTPADTAMDLSWTAADPSADVTYNLYYRKNRDAPDPPWTDSQILQGTTAATGITGTAHTVTGLDSGSNYGFVVVAKKSGYMDRLSAGAHRSTSSNFTTAPVLSASAGAPPQTAVSLSWTAANPSAGVTYNLYYRKNRDAPDPLWTAAEIFQGGTGVTGITSPHTVTGLDPGSSYGFVVVAKKTGYMDRLSDAAHRSTTRYTFTYNTNIALMITRSDGSVAVTWTAPTPSDGVTYDVYCLQNGTTVEAIKLPENKKVSDRSETSYTITGLAVGAKYGVVVTAKKTGYTDSNAVGKASFSTTCTLPDDANSNGIGWTSSSGSISVSDGYNVTFTGSTSKTITAYGNSAITLNNVSIAPYSDNIDSPLCVGGTLTLTLVGTNTLTAADGRGPAGLEVSYGAAVIIEGSGSLTATGGKEGQGQYGESGQIGGGGAGIGSRGDSGYGGYLYSAGTITINSGVIVARGGDGHNSTTTAEGGGGGAGIGGGGGGGYGNDPHPGGNVGTIVIDRNNATVTAYGGNGSILSGTAADDNRHGGGGAGIGGGGGAGAAIPADYTPANGAAGGAGGSITINGTAKALSATGGEGGKNASNAKRGGGGAGIGGGGGGSRSDESKTPGPGGAAHTASGSGWSGITATGGAGNASGATQGAGGAGW